MSDLPDGVREVPLLPEDMPVREAVRHVMDSGMPALPVVAASGRHVGLFGEREFMNALLPGYFDELGYAAFVPRSVDRALHKRVACLDEPVSRYANREHTDVDLDHSDAQLAEIFLHHRVLIVPVTDRGRTVGMVTRRDFFERLATRVLEGQG